MNDDVDGRQIQRIGHRLRLRRDTSWGRDESLLRVNTTLGEHNPGLVPTLSQRNQAHDDTGQPFNAEGNSRVEGSAAEQIQFSLSRRQLTQSKSQGMTNTKSQLACERSRVRFEILCAAVLGAGVAMPRRSSELHQIQE